VDVVHARCCGLDIHKKLVVACLITPGQDTTPQKEIRTFGTMTDDLLALGDWLAGAGCTHVAMESTSVYWKPIYNLLEGSFELLLVNARHIKATSADYPHRQHGLSGRDGHGHRPGASAVRTHLRAG
jgi:transposase